MRCQYAWAMRRCSKRQNYRLIFYVGRVKTVKKLICVSHARHTLGQTGKSVETRRIIKYPGLQIKGVNWTSRGQNSLISHPNPMVLVTQKNCLDETILLSTNNIWFRGEIRKLAWRYPLLSGALLFIYFEQSTQLTFAPSMQKKQNILTWTSIKCI